MSIPTSGSSQVIRIGEAEVDPGCRTQVDLPIADLSIHVPITMPVHIINGPEDGPVLFVSAAIHGDEIIGVEIIRRIMRLSALRALRGALIAVPIVNVPGFLNLSRYLPDRRDLNRSFPGSARGSLAARLARMFLDEVLSNATHGIDLHTGAVHRENLPQTRVDLDNAEAVRMARAFGVLVVNAASREGSLRGAANRLGVPVIVYEGGEALRFDEAAIRAGVSGVVGVIQSLGHVAFQEARPQLARSDDHKLESLGEGAIQRRCQSRAADRCGDRGRTGTRRRLRSLGRGRYLHYVAYGWRGPWPYQPAPRTRGRRALPYRLDGDG